jgi:hypothetical protein
LETAIILPDSPRIRWPRNDSIYSQTSTGRSKQM